MREEWEKNARGAAFQTPRSVARKGRSCSKCQRRDSLTVQREDHVKPGCHPGAQDQSGEDIHTAGHEEPHAEAGGHILMEAAAHEEPSQEQVPGRVVTHGEQPIPYQMFWQL